MSRKAVRKQELRSCNNVFSNSNRLIQIPRFPRDYLQSIKAFFFEFGYNKNSANGIEETSSKCSIMCFEGTEKKELVLPYKPKEQRH